MAVISLCSVPALCIKIKFFDPILKQAVMN